MSTKKKKPKTKLKKIRKVGSFMGGFFGHNITIAEYIAFNRRKTSGLSRAQLTTSRSVIDTAEFILEEVNLDPDFKLIEKTKEMGRRSALKGILNRHDF